MINNVDFECVDNTNICMLQLDH